MSGGDATMAGLDARGDLISPEVMAATAAEMGAVFAVTPEEYIRQHYGTVSLADAIRELVPNTEVTVVPGCGVLDVEPHDIGAAVTAAANADVVIAAIG